VKKIIGIGVALALLTMVVVPVGASAQTWTYNVTPYNSTYSKIPFGILGTGVELIGEVINALGPNITGSLPFNITAVTGLVGPWIEGPFSWLTELTGWTMVAAGDVLSSINSLAVTFGFGNYTGPLANMLYVLGNRMFDSGNIPTVNMSAIQPGFGLNLTALGL
jgi:hypothetical protein